MFGAERAGSMSTSTNNAARQALTISNALSRDHRQHFGRGPESVRTVIQKSYVISFLEGIYSPLEKSLIDADKEDLVMESRLAYQQIRREAFTSVVEGATGQTVRAFLSQNHVAPDIAVEIFVLETNGDEPSDGNDSNPADEPTEPPPSE
jgi:uncharacterized protein YbcI